MAYLNQGIFMKIFFLFFCMSMLLLSQSINEQIHALEDATPEKRVELMNHIKEQLIAMNHEKRMKTIHTLQAKLQRKHENNEHRTSSSLERENQSDEHQSDESNGAQRDSSENRLEAHERHEQMQEEHQRGSQLHQELHQHQERQESSRVNEHEQNRGR